MKTFWKASLAALSILGAAPQGGQAAQSPKVVVSIAPIHALVAGVMEGVGMPQLLVSGGASPHSYSLKPSQARALSNASLVVRVSDQLENFLERAIANLGDKVELVTLTQIKGMTLYETREGGIWEKRTDHSADVDRLEDHDPHIWLDPRNAKRIVSAVSMTLQQTYPGHASVFAANAKKLLLRLDELDRELLSATRSLRGKPYIVFHDTTRYFDERYGLQALGAITVSPDRPAGARRLSEIRQWIKSQAIACVFAEPQFQPKLVQTLISGTVARAGTLDPIGTGLSPGPNLYFKLMRNLAAAMTACLKNPSSRKRAQ